MPTIEQLQKRAQAVRTGGKGSVRRTVKAHHKSNGEDKKVANTLRRFNLTPFGEIDEVVMYRQDGSAFYFEKPKVQFSPQSICVVSGDYETKSAEEIDGKAQ